MVEAQKLLSKYFNKVIELREGSQISERRRDDLQVRLMSVKSSVLQLQDIQFLHRDNMAISIGSVYGGRHVCYVSPTVACCL